MEKFLNKEEEPKVVIFGRTNVGKSTLFNRLNEKSLALVSEIAGTTRDSNQAKIEWRGRWFNLIDTGGFLELKYLKSKKIPAKTIDEQVQKTARQHLINAAVVVFLVDVRAGLTAEDREIAKIINKITSLKNKIILVVNKCDKPSLMNQANEFYRLGFKSIRPISAATGSGTGDLLDDIIKLLPQTKTKIKSPEKSLIKVALVGRPNVGKSSLLNAILGYDRVIVSPIPHTTREPQSATIYYQQENIHLIDTAGISRQGKKTPGLIGQGINKSLSAIKKASIVVLIIDLTAGVTHQEAAIIQEIFKRRKSLIIVGNKWDLIENKDQKKYCQMIYQELPFATFAPILILSAKKREKLNRLLDLIIKLNEYRKIQIEEEKLKNFLSWAIKKHPPIRGKGIRYPHIKSLKQIGTNPPKFILTIGRNEDLDPTYLRYLENQIRQSFNLEGTPIVININKNKI